MRESGCSGIGWQASSAYLPKGFQRVRYYVLQAIASFRKWYEVIARVVGNFVDEIMSSTKHINYIE